MSWRDTGQDRAEYLRERRTERSRRWRTAIFVIAGALVLGLLMAWTFGAPVK